MQKVEICGKQEVLKRWKEYLSDLIQEIIGKNTHTDILRNHYKTPI